MRCKKHKRRLQSARLRSRCLTAARRVCQPGFRHRPGSWHQLDGSPCGSVADPHGTPHSDWARHTDLFAGSVGSSRDRADCARRSPGCASEDAGSIPATSTWGFSPKIRIRFPESGARGEPCRTPHVGPGQPTGPYVRLRSSATAIHPTPAPAETRPLDGQWSAAGSHRWPRSRLDRAHGACRTIARRTVPAGLPDEPQRLMEEVEYVRAPDRTVTPRRMPPQPAPLTVRVRCRSPGGRCGRRTQPDGGVPLRSGGDPGA
jgi:hypothetical protein